MAAVLRLVDGTGDAEMTMVEDARIARDAINRLTTLLAKVGRYAGRNSRRGQRCSNQRPIETFQSRRDRRGAHRRMACDL